MSPSVFYPSDPSDTDGLRGVVAGIGGKRIITGREMLSCLSVTVFVSLSYSILTNTLTKLLTKFLTKMHWQYFAMCNLTLSVTYLCSVFACFHVVHR